MKTLIHLVLATLALVPASHCLAQGDGASGDARVKHVPINQATSERAILRFDVEHPERLGRLLVHVRAAGSEEVQTVEARYDGDEHVAVLHGETLSQPYFRYWVERDVSGEKRAVFASPQKPHYVSVPISIIEEYAKDALARTGGRRSTIWLDSEYVGLSTADSDTRSQYLHGELGYRYAFLTWVDHIAFRAGMLRSDIPSNGPLDKPLEEGESPPNIGFDYAGASAQFRIHPYLRLRAGLLFGISEAGFEYGAHGEVILGEPHRTTLAVGVEGTRTRGLVTHARLAWNSVKNVPMSATIAVTNFPTGESMGVQLRYDIGYKFSKAFGARIGLGYRGQHAQQGGLVAGLGLDFSF